MAVIRVRRTRRDDPGRAWPRLVPLGAALLACASAEASACNSLEATRWLLGSWQADGGKRIVTETWIEASTTTFEGVGISRTRTDGKVVDGEALRLVAMAEAVFYVAKVAHNHLPVAFRLTTCEPERLVFENPGHDFPRRLEYRRVGADRMEVYVSDGAERGFTLDFRHLPAP